MSNNKQTMKLYTESEVRKAIELARLIQEKGSVEDSFDVESISGLSEICTYGWSERYSTDEISEQLTPIQLPSDEEIYKEAYSQRAMVFSFKDGAKWQAERMYSEEEVRKILWEYVKPQSTSEGILLDGFLEQFKKK